METVSDVVVVGGGPCGSFSALNLARIGIKVTVFEEHDEIGVPCHCAGHLSIKGLKQLGLHPLPSEIVENSFCGAIFHSPGGKEFSVRFHSPVTCVVNRVLFDKHVAKMAETLGTRYRLNSVVASLLIDDSFVKGVVVKEGGKTERKFWSKIVLDAEGISSKILRQTGLRTFNRGNLVNGVHAEVENVKDLEPDMVEVYLGKDYAPGFYAWLTPKGDDRAKVGLAAKSANPRELLRKLMLKHPAASKKLCSAKVLQNVFHPIPLGGPIPKAYSNGLMAVGDVASHVKPTTGGGVVFGMISAKIAADVALEALQRDDFSSRFLGLYQRRVQKLLGFDLNAMLRIRKMLDAMSDAKLDDAIGFCRRFGLEDFLRSIEDIDFQGQALLNALRSPRALAALVYFFMLYLSANP